MISKDAQRGFKGFSGKDSMMNRPSDTRVKRQKVQVWIYYQNPQNQLISILLLRTRPDRGNFWQPVTGGVEKDETLEEAALREAKEETGLKFSTLPVAISQPFEFKSRWGNDVIEFGFTLEALLSDGDTLPQVILDPTEHVESCWISAKEALEKVSYPSNAKVLRSLLKYLTQKN